MQRDPQAIAEAVGKAAEAMLGGCSGGGPEYCLMLKQLPSEEGFCLP